MLSADWVGQPQGLWCRRGDHGGMLTYASIVGVSRVLHQPVARGSIHCRQ
jgi:hypothetical protein